MPMSIEGTVTMAGAEPTAPGVEYSPQVQGRLISCSRPAPGIDFYTFLRQGEGQPRYYWRNGRSGVTLAGAGMALSLMGWSEGRFHQIQRQAQALFGHALILGDTSSPATPRLFGGFAFRQDFVPDYTWSAFQPAHFILPHYQLVRQADQTWLTINALLPPGEEPDALHTKLQEALDARCAHLQAATDEAVGLEKEAAGYEISYPLSYEAWVEMLEEALRRLAHGPLRKVVLARVCEVRRAGSRRIGGEEIDVDLALRRLDASYPDCYTFLIEPRPHHAFLGATPELLAAVQGDRLQTMGLAGSAPRGATPAADRQIADDLLNSAKDRLEHDLVVQALRERLAPMTQQLDVPEAPVIMSLNNIHHLYTPIEGRLQAAQGVLPVVEILHPTPALGGWPREMALDFIEAYEETPRGWYAAPVGWIDHNLDGVFAVAIRSAVVQRSRAWLYAGGGIVADSQPQREWEETRWKFRPILEALGVGREAGSEGRRHG